MLLRALVALPAIFLVLSVASSSAAALAPPHFVGLQSYKQGSSELEKLRTARVHEFRAMTRWGTVEPNRPNCVGSPSCHSYRWTYYDNLFEAAARRGVRVLPTLSGSPTWANRDTRWPPMTSFTRRAYMDFVAAFTRRYGPHGAFWAGKSYGASALRARYLQIWNEPNLKNYWNDNPQPSQYASFLYAASNSAIAADADVRIVSAGLPWGKGIPPEDFLRGMNVWGSGQVFRKISAVGVHVYKSYPHQIPPALRSIRATLRSLSTTAGARPVWITEMGWATGPFDGRYQVSEARQAANLKEIYNTLVSLKDSGSYNIDRAYWYNLVDVEPGDRWWRNTGLFRRSGTPKPAWRELKRVTGAV